ERAIRTYRRIRAEDTKSAVCPIPPRSEAFSASRLALRPLSEVVGQEHERRADRQAQRRVNPGSAHDAEDHRHVERASRWGHATRLNDWPAYAPRRPITA